MSIFRRYGKIVEEEQLDRIIKKQIRHAERHPATAPKTPYKNIRISEIGTIIYER